MSSSDRKLESQLAKSGEEHQPPYAWQEQVWRRLEEAPHAAPPPRRTGVAPWLVTCMVAVALFAGGGMAMLMQNSAGSADQALVAMDLKLKKQLERQEEWEQEVAQTQQEIAVFQEELERAFAELESAIDENERDAARVAASAAKLQLESKLARLEELRQSNMERNAKAKKVIEKKMEKSLVNTCAKSADPLCGL